MSYNAEDLQQMFPLLSTAEANSLTAAIPTQILDKIFVKVLSYEQSIHNLQEHIAELEAELEVPPS